MRTVLLFLMTALSSALFAADDPYLPPGAAIELTPMQKGFTRLDRNADGFIDTEEARQRYQLSDQFGAWDTNDDDRINFSEFSAFEVGVEPPAETD